MTLHRCFLMWSPTGMPVGWCFDFAQHRGEQAKRVEPRNPEPLDDARDKPCRRAGACVEWLKANAMFDRPVFLS